jgi:hypothetical protein
MTEVRARARRAARVLFVAALAARGAAAAEADPAALALRDAQQLVECLRALDARCAARYTNTRYLEEQGASREELIAAAVHLDEDLKSLGARYTRFELGRPSAPFAGDGRLYTFVPYTQTLEAGDKKATVTAFFIGISADAGASWTFVDGVNTSADNIRQVIPSYAGAPLPPKSLPAASAGSGSL